MQMLSARYFHDFSLSDNVASPTLFRQVWRLSALTRNPRERSIDQDVSGGQLGAPGVEDIIEALWGTRVSPSIDGVRPEHLRDDRCLVQSVD